MSDEGRLRFAQGIVLGQLKEEQRALDAADVRREHLVREARRLAVSWEAIADVVGMERQKAWRKWKDEVG